MRSFVLEPYYVICGEADRYSHLFWRSLNQLITQSLREVDRFEPARHYSFGANRHHTEITSDEIADILLTMKAARIAFLRTSVWELRSANLTSDCRAVLERIDRSCRSPIWELSDVIDEIRRAVKDGRLIFVPLNKDLHRCVKAIREDRLRESGLHQRRQARHSDEMVAVLEPKGEVRQQSEAAATFHASDSVSLERAQPFEYVPDELSDEVEQLAASTNSPKFAAKMLGYDQKTFGKMLHKLKPQNGLSPSDNVIFHDDGGVEFNGRMLDDNIHNYAP
jgi:hypothetical protein